LKKFNYSIDDDIAFQEKYQITPTELFVLKIILLLQEDTQDEEYLKRFLQISDNKECFRDTLQSLQNKGLILKSYKIPNKGEPFNPYDIAINKVLIKNMHKASFDLGQELMEVYPRYGMINGGMVPLHGVSKRFGSREDFFRFYSKIINWNPETHSKIIELIKWEQANNVGFLNMTVLSFVIDHRWEALQDIKDGKLSNVTFNTIESL
jgi:hypothetical protein